MKFKANIKKEELLSILYKKVKNIRDDLNLTNVDFEIVDLELEINNNGNICDCSDNIYLIIYTPTRSDKSTIIGPGGWVVGKLREELKELFNGNLIIRVEDYSDKIIMDEKKENAMKILKDIGLNKWEKIAVLVQCMNDLSILDFLKKYFLVYAISLDVGTIIMPSKNKQTIKNYMRANNIPHKFIKSTGMKNEEILKIINTGKNPCELFCNNMDKHMIQFCFNNDIKYVINNHIENKIKIVEHSMDDIKNSMEDNEEYPIYVLNFSKIYPLKSNDLRNKYLNCPLLIQSIKRNKDIGIKLIEEIVACVYEGYSEPTECSENIVKIYNLYKK
jgi:predicted PP-loop superfamily ATPase